MSKEIDCNPFKTIALSLSGGGYRATCFHLGTMCYLDSLSYNDKSLLERAKVISSVSGGTFVAVIYAECLAKGLGLKECFHRLYHFMTEVDVIGEAFDILKEKKWDFKKNKNLINAVSIVYRRHLTQECFGVLWNESKSHLTEISFNSTDFASGINFRFQKTKDDQGYIGNKYFQEKVEKAKHIRLADIIATSSCFPGGFEPILYPDDFMDENCVDNAQHRMTNKNSVSKRTFPLMDGGIYDNQGIDAVLLACDRMRRFYPEHENQEMPIDLYIISDVAEGPSKPFVLRKMLFKGRLMSSLNLNLIMSYSLIVALIILVVMLITKPKAFLIIETLFFSISFFLFLIIFAAKHCLCSKKLLRMLYIPEVLDVSLKKIFSYNLNTLLLSVYHRITSLIYMSSSVFMRQVRRLSIKQIYENEKWEQRRILNAIWDLRKDKVDGRNKDQELGIAYPSEKILNLTKEAMEMKTTLWFRDEELTGETTMPDKLIVCGQYTCCFNLLQYIERLFKSGICDSLDDAGKRTLELLRKKLRSDWDRFNTDPFWQLAEYKER